MGKNSLGTEGSPGVRGVSSSSWWVLDPSCNGTRGVPAVWRPGREERVVTHTSDVTGTPVCRPRHGTRGQ